MALLIGLTPEGSLREELGYGLRMSARLALRRYWSLISRVPGDSLLAAVVGYCTIGVISVWQLRSFTRCILLHCGAVHAY